MVNEDALLQELTFKAVRSSGAGGQHVNKVSSKVELIFNLTESSVFNEEQRERLISKLQSRLTKEGILMLQCDESRSQHKNKELVIKRFFELIENSLIIPKKRIPTKIPRAVIKKRLKSKRKLSDKKVNRQKPDID
ncbi:Peptidyl-tRNA hydrolase ArfB [Mariniflexile rhizosphaerae]|uniref:alternative ribosome rescue aminoacyl-tRNA hydrolase ArfB n=1 Tax=unclassified Mariniflexile TaxID=2643887 RepID=UPI000CA72FF4|nr:alternative ribosome rescue aminoacyl-tRNA hydrolase ArfB [Mariniflexile sp. TRM1-10]AXP80295.1 Peptidyl-tRNA hydrolase ArfB [Mariniflexile sp. TRM1-10]PLB17968.1 MAG: Class I peptide chain release factor [Flavobacteriaceae bacterium FS1-H7996/R]